ncbi:MULTISPECIES: DUF1223 domain-containing protein [Ramlibacter]|uniref:DUF1223 domain-containing protein n=1 Tax=Ramlibacter pinisoli TaxID=2682844 RepID=A0A6N8IQ86_9BURK|nr:MULTISPECIES: DUF1223 domain-containing protein [Ramlibacter]MBA2960673.1 DUF1223 domain-containing protein [Ramlibacter sp. CGMCC 1.13660]MVQ28003.1 DUF1223 domain-containing protein [Ramlibacter pinisoli]
MPLRLRLRHLILGAALPLSAAAAAASCEAVSRPQLTPVIELYTSEGCSSCPPADRWLSGLKPAAAQGRVVAQAFHVGYWDNLGWVDRFALAAATARQRELAAANQLRSIYTPQLVRNGRDWRDYDSALLTRAEPARASIRLLQRGPDLFEATVVPTAPDQPWAAYWTLTEHGHASKVRAGENAGAELRHDFVVRQYVPAGTRTGTQQLQLRTIARDGDAPRSANLVVVDPATLQPLQALSLSCPG